MSLPTSPEPGSKRIAVRKPGMDVYTALLILAVVALLIGILLFVLELSEYNWTVNPTAWLHRAPLSERLGILPPPLRLG